MPRCAPCIQIKSGRNHAECGRNESDREGITPGHLYRSQRNYGFPLRPAGSGQSLTSEPLRRSGTELVARRKAGGGGLARVADPDGPVGMQACAAPRRHSHVPRALQKTRIGKACAWVKPPLSATCWSQTALRAARTAASPRTEQLISLVFRSTTISSPFSTVPSRTFALTNVVCHCSSRELRCVS